MTALLSLYGASLLVVLLRVLPVVLLCPLLGAALVPGPVRLSLALAITVWVRGAAGVTVSLDESGWVGLAVEQLALGTVMGLAMSWSYEMALAAGRWGDLFRGSSAEAFNPATGSRDSAGGALLHRLLVATACAGGALPALVAELGRSFLWSPPGHWAWTEDMVGWVAGLSHAFEAGAVVAAPFALMALSVDASVAFLQRMAPVFPLAELALPARLLLGGLFWIWDLAPAVQRLPAPSSALQQLIAGHLP